MNEIQMRVQLYYNNLLTNEVLNKAIELLQINSDNENDCEEKQALETIIEIINCHKKFQKYCILSKGEIKHILSMYFNYGFTMKELLERTKINQVQEIHEEKRLKEICESINYPTIKAFDRDNEIKLHRNKIVQLETRYNSLFDEIGSVPSVTYNKVGSNPNINTKGVDDIVSKIMESQEEIKDKITFHELAIKELQKIKKQESHIITKYGLCETDIAKIKEFNQDDVYCQGNTVILNLLFVHGL